MKKFILTLLIAVIHLTTHAQQDINGAFGIPFGSTKAKVVEMMKTKGYALSPNSQATANFKKVNFGAFKNCDVVFKFTNNKLFEILILLPDILDSKLIEQYNDVVKELTSKYGEPEAYKNFKKPYEDGDGYEVTAIKTGYATFVSFWFAGNGSITTEIQSDAFVTVKYQDNVLVEEAIKAQKKKNSSDY